MPTIQPLPFAQGHYAELHWILEELSVVESHLLCFKVKCSLFFCSLFSDEEQKTFLKEAGISDEIILATKVGLAIPWSKIQLLVEIINSHAHHDILLKASNVSLACGENAPCLKKDSR